MDAHQQIQEHMKALAGVIAEQKKARRREQQKASALNSYYRDHEKTKEELRKRYAERRAAKLAEGWVPKPRGRPPTQKGLALLAAKNNPSTQLHTIPEEMLNTALPLLPPMPSSAAPAAVENGSANSVAHAAV